MSDIITTLHPENDAETNLYPNIKKENIPSEAIDRSKLDNDVNGLLNNIGELHPAGVDTSTNILAKTSDSGIWVASNNGKWYYWNGSQYTEGGAYIQNMGDYALQNNAVTGVGHYNTLPAAPFDDMNTFTPNTIICFDDGGNSVANIPPNFRYGVVVTLSYNKNNTIHALQIVSYRDGSLYYRNKYADTWSSWKKVTQYPILATDLDTTFYNQLIQGYSNFSSLPPAPYNDFNTFNVNTIVAFSEGGNLVSNHPDGFRFGMVFTYSYSKTSNIHITQIVTSYAGDMWLRYKYGDTWSSWNKLTTDVNKDIFENNPFSLSLFESIAVIGDSYASGLLVDYSIPLSVNVYSKSWIQILGRMYGIEATNYSANGVNAKTWFTTNGCYSKFQADTAKELYYICLGINDETTEMGSTSDINLSDYTQNADTFYGNMGKIISMIKEKSPNGKIIVSTTPQPNNTTKNNAIKEIATYCGVPYLVIYDDPLISSSIYTTDFRAQGHPTLIGYSAYAKAYDRQTSKCIENNVAYFKYFQGIN